jgi:hypothetical protein
MCVDARSRRLFRAALGAAQLREVLLVWPDRHDFFVSGGVLLQPENIYIGASNNIVTASVVTVLLALHALAASGLLLGLWPRSCAIISFALQFWRIHQNDEVACTDSGLLAMSAIWAALMRYSALGKEPARVDIASLGPVVMLSCMYAASAIHKLIARRGDAPDSSAPWLDGTAVAEALACCEHQKALGRLLLQSHSLCRALTWLTVALEGAAPVGLLLCDGAARFALLLALLGFHGVLHLTLELGNFSVVCAALLCICVPAAAWDAGELFIRALWGAQATATAPPKTEGPPAARSDPAQPNASARRLLSAQPLSAGLIGLTVIGAVVTFPSDTEPPAPPAAGLFGTGVTARDASAGGASGWRPWRHPWWRQLGDAVSYIGISPRMDFFALPPDDCGWYAHVLRPEPPAASPGPPTTRTRHPRGTHTATHTATHGHARPLSSLLTPHAQRPLSSSGGCSRPPSPTARPSTRTSCATSRAHPARSARAARKCLRRSTAPCCGRPFMSGSARHGAYPPTRSRPILTCSRNARASRSTTARACPPRDHCASSTSSSALLSSAPSGACAWARRPYTSCGHFGARWCEQTAALRREAIAR